MLSYHTSLLLALEYNNTTLVSPFLQKGIPPRWLLEQFAKPLLFRASFGGCVGLVPTLLDAGINLNDRSTQHLIFFGQEESRSYICYDLFLAECDKQSRDEIHESFILTRPIHQVVKKGNVYHIAMKKGMEQLVAERYLGMRSFDSGPLPLFSDYQNPPLYIDGRRVDRRELEEGYSSERASEEVEQNSLANLGDGGTEHRLPDEDNANQG
ncbi:hypothetical protein N7494_008149 [Penicillium frequentans]|uniref:Uncharacterized protein n=1 Tax=Penicillium frequentans TaxID=3151616 RepID=A0AAD6CTY0_9EURO|nr:hypothetical protein N7494_008149 [Penicillium glabrum]